MAAETLISPSEAESIDLTEVIECEDPLKAADANAQLIDHNSTRFRRRLIAHVRRQRVLYDKKHKYFSNVAVKDEAWDKIAQKLQVEAEVCKNAWADLRYDYQNYARRLRKFFKSSARAGKRKRRPQMPLETDMIFLWRLVDKQSGCEASYDDITDDNGSEVTTLTVVPEDDDIMLLEDLPVVIELDDEENEEQAKSINSYNFVVIRSDTRQLVELIKAYSELYDPAHRYFNDYKRKGIIWHAISNEMGDKATKLMKSWIQLQTRFEWEINQADKSESELAQLLEFLRPHISKTPNTVYKQSYYLQRQWYEPIDHFKNIFNLLTVMKRFPLVVKVTEDRILGNSDYCEGTFFACWDEIAKSKVLVGLSGQREVTWLLLRQFYWELITMRKHGYQLQDKWYFESIITELYSLAAAAAVPQSDHACMAKPPPTNTPPPLSSTAAVHSIPVNVDEDKIASSVIETIHGPQSQQDMLERQKKLARQLKLKSQRSQMQQKPNLTPQPIVSQVPLTQVDQNTSTNTQLIQSEPPQLLPPQPQLIEYCVPQMPQLQPLPPTQPILQGVLSTTDQIMTPIIASAKSLAPCLQQQKTFSSNAIKGVQIKQIPTTMLPTIVSATSLNAAARNSSSTTVVTLPVHPAPMHPAPVQIQLPFPLPEHTSMISLPTQQKIAKPKRTPSTAITIVPKEANISLNCITRTAQSWVPLPTPTPESQLNSNEIMIELIASQKGNQLSVHGPPLAERYSLPMLTTAHFIRSVMAIPLLHNKKHNQQAQVTAYWQHLSNKFKLPVHICRACWNFLTENFNHFPQIAPMKELMKPFKIDIAVWTESQTLFNTFNVEAVAMGLLQYRDVLPKFMEEIGKCADKVSRKNGEKLCYEIDWLPILRKFPELSTNVVNIWKLFKEVFTNYMVQLEFGVTNKWPENWWRTLANMRFMLEERYHNMEPFYYIVRNKITEEITRCSQQEQSAETLMTQFPIKEGKKNTPSPSLSPKPISELSCEFQPQDIRIAPPLQKPSDIDAYNLILAIRRHPRIYTKCFAYQKVVAWRSVAKEMGTTVTECRLAFQFALLNYRLHVARDPANRCRINQRYFKHMAEIYRTVKSIGKINVKTPMELNQSIGDSMDSNEIVLPERYIPDINMDTCKPALVMKNWTHGIGHFSKSAESALSTKLRKLFDKYRPLANWSSVEKECVP